MCYRTKVKASITVEAALAVPLLFFACMTFLYIFHAYFTFGHMQEALYQKGEIQCREESRDKFVICRQDYTITIPVAITPVRSLFVKQVCVTYPLQGKSIVPEEDREDGEEYVFLTPYGEVYHKREDCVYLKPAIKELVYKEVADKRNSSGGIYYPCERCVKKASVPKEEKVLITPYGDRYHKDSSCPGLKRTILKVRKEEAEGKRECSKCGKE